MEYKILHIELKDVSDTGTFRGMASVFDIEDQGGDVVERGAFTKTLQDPKRKNRRPLLWSHDTKEPIGDVWLKETREGLEVEKGEISLDVQRGREVHALMLRGTINALSIGYQSVPVKTRLVNGSRYLAEVKLWEVSPVVFPMLMEAEITQVKALTEAEEKRIVQRGDQWCVVSEDASRTLGCHDVYSDAVDHLRAIEANKEDPVGDKTTPDPTPTPAPEIKAATPFAVIFAWSMLWRARYVLAEALWESLDSIMQDSSMDAGAQDAAVAQALADFGVQTAAWVTQYRDLRSQAKTLDLALETKQVEPDEQKAGAKIAKARLQKIKAALDALQAVMDEVEPEDADEKSQPLPGEPAPTVPMVDAVDLGWSTLLADMDTFVKDLRG